MFLGKRLRFIRKKNGLSQRELGKMLHVSKASVSGYEKGKRQPSIDVFISILELFRVSADYMLGLDFYAVAESNQKLVLNVSSDDIRLLKIIKDSPDLYKNIIYNPEKLVRELKK